MSELNLEELKRLHAKATPGEWNIDTEKNEGDYGSGDPDDVRTSFESYALHAPSGTICDTLNSDLISVNEESDGESGDIYAWDEVGERNMKWIAAIHNAFPAILAERQAMLDRLEAAESDVLRLHKEKMAYYMENIELKARLEAAQSSNTIYTKEDAEALCEIAVAASHHGGAFNHKFFNNNLRLLRSFGLTKEFDALPSDVKSKLTAYETLTLQLCAAFDKEPE